MDEKKRDVIIAVAKKRWPELEEDKLQITEASLGKRTMIFPVLPDKGCDSFREFCVELEPVGEWLMGFAIWPAPTAKHTVHVLVVDKGMGYNPPPIEHVRPPRPTPAPPTIVTKRRTE